MKLNKYYLIQHRKFCTLYVPECFSNAFLTTCLLAAEADNIPIKRCPRHKQTVSRLIHIKNHKIFNMMQSSAT